MPRNEDSFMAAIEAIKGSLGRIVETMEESEKREELLATQRKMLLPKICMLERVSKNYVIDATRDIVPSPSKLAAFFGCPNDHLKKLYVQKVLVRLHGSTGASQE